MRSPPDTRFPWAEPSAALAMGPLGFYVVLASKQEGGGVRTYDRATAWRQGSTPATRCAPGEMAARVSAPARKPAVIGSGRRLLDISSYISRRSGAAVADEEHIRRLQQGTEASNTWRRDILRRGDLSHADLRDANLNEADLKAYLRGADLGDGYLRGVNLRGANLREANLSGAFLSRANLGDANLSGANLSGTNLTGTNLSEANLSGASLIYADLWRANLKGANLGPRCIQVSKPMTSARVMPVKAVSPNLAIVRFGPFRFARQRSA